MKNVWLIALISIALGLFSCSKDEGKEEPVETTLYTVTFKTDGGMPVPAVQQVKAGSLATAPATNPAKTGYVFMFWYVNGATTAYNFQTPVGNNITLYAKWAPDDQPGEVTALTLDKTSLTLRTTDRDRITATTNASGKAPAVSWSSSDPLVALVDRMGIVTATGAGKAVITASAGNKSAHCSVDVSYSVIVGGGTNEPVLWKNGEEFKFASYNAPKSIHSVFVYEGDIYVTGTKTEIFSNVVYSQAVVIRIQSVIPGDPYDAATTDQLMELKGKKSFGEDMFISNGDVYVVGSEKAINMYNQEYSRAVVWKNGKLQQILSDSDVSVNAEARSVFVSGNDVYIVGNYGYWVNDGVWKNGQFELLDDPPESHRIRAYSVFVSDGDVYVAGAAYYKSKPVDITKPVLWKNGVPTVLDERGVFYSVFVSGDDVYTAGSANMSPVWKNDVPMSFDEEVLIRSIYLYDNDVYATGSKGLWINGVKQSWGASGNCVFVK